MSTAPVQVVNKQNSLGVAGFVISLVGYVSCGILCPVGMLISLFAMRREPRGLAVAGVVIGGIGTFGFLLLWIFAGGSILVSFVLCGGGLACCGGVAPQIVTKVHMNATAREVERFEKTNGRLPNTLDEIDGHERRSRRDGWDRPLRIEPDGKGGFFIFSDGPDGTPGNGDDIKSPFSG